MRHMVVAKTRRGVIGRGGVLPWDIPEELAHFRQLTWGGNLIMGRKTFESIGEALPGRRTLVLSRSGQGWPGARTCGSLAAALDVAEAGTGEAFIVGGASVYEQALALDVVDRLHVSDIAEDHEGDVFFPEIDAGKWRQVSESSFTSFTYKTYEPA